MHHRITPKAQTSLLNPSHNAMTSAITPAHLGFLAIYNPSLSSASQDEDALAHQIVYYASVTTLSRRRRRTGRKKKGRRERSRLTEDVSHEERNERLRQIGLAQGMVEFSRGFSGGDAVDVIETEKSRVVVHEVEPGWWILSVGLITILRLSLTPSLFRFLFTSLLFLSFPLFFSYFCFTSRQYVYNFKVSHIHTNGSRMLIVNRSHTATPTT